MSTSASSPRHLPATGARAAEPSAPLATSLRELAAWLSRKWDAHAARRSQHRADAYLRALAARDPRIQAELDAAIARGLAHQAAREEAYARQWLARHPTGTFNAAYQGPRRNFHTAPLTGLPTHLQYLPT